MIDRMRRETFLYLLLVAFDSKTELRDLQRSLQRSLFLWLSRTVDDENRGTITDEFW